MSTVGDSWEDIPLAKRRKMLLEQRGMQPKLPPTLSQKPPAPPLSDPSDVIYILGDSEDDDHAANSSPVQRQNPIVGGSGAGAFILVAPQERKNDNDNTLGSDSGGGGDGEERGEEEEVEEEEEEAVATTNETVAQERPPPSPPHLPPPPPPPSRPPLATTKPTKKMKYTKEMLDAPYDFAANREYRRKVGLRNPTRNKRLEPAFGRNKATGAADGRKRKEAVATQEHQIAWKAAALRWREKNKPSAEELKQRAAEQAASRTNVHYTPAAARMSEAATAAACAAATAAAIRKPTSSCPRPPPDAPETEWRSYYRHVAQRRIEPAPTLFEALKLLGVPFDDSSTVKDAYRLAVRMYHPDSNSKERVWSTAVEKIQAEEVMKIINERKEKERGE